MPLSPSPLPDYRCHRRVRLFSLAPALALVLFAAGALLDTAAAAAKEASPPPLPPAEAGGSDESDAPNLLGGAYESSEDEEGPIPAPPAAAAPETGGESSPPVAGEGVGAETPGQGERSEASPLTPDEEKRQVVEKMVGYVAKNGQAFEDRVRNR